MTKMYDKKIKEFINFKTIFQKLSSSCYRVLILQFCSLINSWPQQIGLSGTPSERFITPSTSSVVPPTS